MSRSVARSKARAIFSNDKPSSRASARADDDDDDDDASILGTTH